VTSASTYVTNTLANGQTTTQAVVASTAAATTTARPSTSSAGAAQAIQTAGLFVPMGVAVAALGFAVGL